ncbi:MAG: hypothetical protein CFE45_31210 [Burkholderiales bacterium PBB5]|nr:MAG: hypothetical protein CFE45_31210 [Burkholderiales bacterium PBB5]
MNRINQLLAASLLAAVSLSAQAAFVYQNDFEANANGVSGAGGRASSEGFSAFGFGQQYFRNAAGGNPATSSVLTFNLAGAATGVTLGFDLAVLDSWDGANCCGPDFFNVKVDGTSIYSKNFSIFDGVATGSELLALVYGQGLAASGSWADAGYSLSFSLGNLAAGAHTIEFFASGNVWQAGDDESFAIDNLKVQARSIDQGNNVPEPESYGLVALALAGLALTTRRRAR